MNWNDISIKQYQEIKTKDATGYERLSIATGKDVDELEELTPSQFLKLSEVYSFLNHEPNPTLVSNWDGYNILDMKNAKTADRIIDFIALIEMNDYIGNLDKIISVLCVDPKRPDEDFETKTNKIAENMPITIAFGIADFFLQNFNLNKKTIPYYLEKVKQGKVNPILLMNRLSETTLN